MRSIAAATVLALWGGLAWTAEPACQLATRASAAGISQTLALEGSAYRDFAVVDQAASFVVAGEASPQQMDFPAGPVSLVTITPLEPGNNPGLAQASEYKVEITFRAAPSSSLINQQPAVPGQDSRIIAGFTFPPERSSNSRPLGGGRSSRSDAEDPGAPGRYKLPLMPPAHYSDALVTLKVNGGDFREILWLMSEIGQVSIILDPYWFDEPTGSKRGVGGGVDGSIDPGERAPGFRPGGGFDPQAPREGVGNLSLDFKEVPFDLALDLVLQAVNLVKVDIHSSR